MTSACTLVLFRFACMCPCFEGTPYLSCLTGNQKETSHPYLSLTRTPNQKPWGAQKDTPRSQPKKRPPPPPKKKKIITKKKKQTKGKKQNGKWHPLTWPPQPPGAATSGGHSSARCPLAAPRPWRARREARFPGAKALKNAAKTGGCNRFTKTPG